MGVKQNLVARQRVPESPMIIRHALLPALNFRFVQEQESISITKKDKTLIKVSDLFFSRRKNLLFSAFYGNTGIVFLECDLAADIMPEGHSTAFSKDFLQLNWAEEKLK